MPKMDIDHVEQFFEGTPRGLSSNIDLLSIQNKKVDSKDGACNGGFISTNIFSSKSGLGKVLADNLFCSWMESIYYVCHMFTNIVGFTCSLSKLYIFTLILLGIHILVLFAFGGVLLSIFLILLGFLPAVCTIFVVPLLIGTTARAYVSSCWHVVKQISYISSFMQLLRNCLKKLRAILWFIVPEFEMVDFRNYNRHSFEDDSAQMKQRKTRFTRKPSPKNNSLNLGNSDHVNCQSDIPDDRENEEINPESIYLRNDRDDFDYDDSNVYFSFSDKDDNAISYAGEMSAEYLSSSNVSSEINHCSELGVVAFQKLKNVHDLLGEMKNYSKSHTARQ